MLPHRAMLNSVNVKEIIKTTLLEYEKSTFLIDLVRHTTGQLYIEVKQTITVDEARPETQRIRINPSVLDDLIETLTYYKKDLPRVALSNAGYYTEEKKAEIKRRYLKGLSIGDIALQFDCSNAVVEQILRNSGIEIVSNKMPGKRKGTWYRKRRHK